MGLRDPFNAISHVVGAGLALAAIPVLVFRAEGPLATACSAVFGGALLASYTMSALYHAVGRQPSIRLLLLDQACIYPLIAATYTPWALLVFGGALGWGVVVAQWSIAALGVALLLNARRTPAWVHLAAYGVLTWGGIVLLPFLPRVPGVGLALVFAGGVFYSAGALFYRRNRHGTLGIGDHGLWHVLALAGSGAHVAAMWLYVLPFAGAK